MQVTIPDTEFSTSVTLIPFVLFTAMSLMSPAGSPFGLSTISIVKIVDPDNLALNSPEFITLLLKSSKIIRFGATI